MESFLFSVYGALAAYLKTWTFGRILDKPASGRLSLEDVHQQVLHRIAADARFRDELLGYPLFVWAIVIEEGLGINKFTFVSGIKQVHILQETEERLYLKLPACHRGCTAKTVALPPEGHGDSKCHVCGITRARESAGCSLAGAVVTSESATLSRKEIEERMIERATRDAEFKDALVGRPLQTYSSYARTLCCGRVPPYLERVREIALREERMDEVCVLLPASCHSAAAPR